MKIKIINKSRQPLPSYATPGSAGMDLRADLDEVIDLQPLERTLIPTGLFLEIPVGYEAQVRPRSGLALKKGIGLVNSPGTIDSDYRGEIGVIVINLSNAKVTIQPGERIAQLVVAPYTRVEWTPVHVLAESTRGDGGFGHSGTA